MREDMQDVIINTSRVGGERVHGSRRAAVRNAISARTADLLSAHERIRPRWPVDRKGLTDRLSPLERFLESRVGQKWDSVHSEINEATDLRSLRGWHLSAHLQDLIGREWSKFTVDNRGVLQRNEKRRTRYARTQTPGLTMLHNGLWLFDTGHGVFEIHTTPFMRALDFGYGRWPESFGPRPRELASLVIVSYRQLPARN